MPAVRADIVIIGGGITGVSIARELSRYQLKIVLLEKSADVARGASGANSGIVHAGYDPVPGTLKARLNVRGSRLFPELAAELDIPFRRTGSLVVATAPEELPGLRTLLHRGRRNGVAGLRIISGARAAEMVPKLTPRAAAALEAPSAGITCPYQAVIALAENAAANGVRFMLNTRVTGIIVQNGSVKGVMTGGGAIHTGCVINAAGVHADAVAAMAGDSLPAIVPRRGEYCLLDRKTGSITGTVLFPMPSSEGKGILAAPTIDGNILLGPTSEAVADREDAATTARGIHRVLEGTRRLLPEIPVSAVIAEFAGVRATLPGGDFIIGASEGAEGLFNVAGIDSPGLAAAPAIAEMVTDILRERGMVLKPKKTFKPRRKRIARLTDLPEDEMASLIKRRPAYGRIVCRCENVTLAEILESLERNPGAATLDAVKRRTRAGMGRCQGGFCAPEVAEILAGRLGIPLTEVTQKGGNSRIIWGPVKAPFLCAADQGGQED